MKQSLVLSFLILLTTAVKADLPGRAFQYDLYAQNENYYFKSVPFHRFDQTTFGKTIVFNAKTNEKIYQIDNYLPRPSFLSNNGKSAVTLSYWLAGHDNFADQELIQFYVNGKKGKRYFIKDIITGKKQLDYTVSHTIWYDKVFISNDTLFILMLDDKVILVDVNRAKIIGTKNRSFMTKRFDLENLPLSKSIVYYEIKYPEPYQFPDLADNSTFREALISYFKKTEVKDYDSCRYYTRVSGVIDRNGNCEIYLHGRQADQEENNEWNRQVATWVTKQKYKTDLIPINCDKWVFMEYFYLR